MITGRDFSMKREQHLDRLQEAEKERLIKQITGDEGKPGLWQSLSHWFTGPGHQEEMVSGQSYLVEESR